MKCLTLIVPASMKRDLADQLRNIEAVDGFTIFACEGHSSETQHDIFLSVRDRVEGYVPRARVELILEDSKVNTVIETLKESFSSNNKDRTRIGIWFLTELQGFGEL